jgi:hypothetical protein
VELAWSCLVLQFPMRKFVKLPKAKYFVIAVFALLVAAAVGVSVFNFLADDTPESEILSYYRQMTEWAKTDEPVWVYGVANLGATYSIPQTEVFTSACYFILTVNSEIEDVELLSLISQLYESYGYSYIYKLVNQTEFNPNQPTELCIKQRNFNAATVAEFAEDIEIEQVESVSDPRRQMVQNFYLIAPDSTLGLSSLSAAIYTAQDDKLLVLISRHKVEYYLDQFGRKDWVITEVEPFRFEQNRAQNHSDDYMVGRLLNGFSATNIPISEDDMLGAVITAQGQARERLLVKLFVAAMFGLVVSGVGFIAVKLLSRKYPPVAPE